MTTGNLQEMKTWNQQVSDVLGVVFVFAVLLFATQGLQQSFIDWVTPLMNPDWDELSRRAQRVAKKEGIFGGTFQFLKQNIYSKTGLQLGIPLTLSFMMVVMAEPDRGRTRVWNLTLAAVALIVFGFWAITVSYRDSQLISQCDNLGLYIQWYRHCFNADPVTALFWLVHHAFCTVLVDLPFCQRLVTRLASDLWTRRCEQRRLGKLLGDDFPDLD